MPAYALGNTARYAVPAVRNGYIARPRLLEQLHASIGGGITLLQAPGGYGKTALAAAFLRDVDFEGRWLTLDGTATAPETFAQQVVTAILGDEAWQPASAEGDGALTAYLGAALRTFDDNTDRPLLFVIDNAHELAASEASLELLSWLLGAMPFGAELLFLSRTAIPVPEFDRGISGGDIRVFGPADLAFTEDEVAQLAATYSDAPSPSDICIATNGWPIAVAGTLNGTLTLMGAAGAVASGTWERYLASEVATSIPKQHADALAIASIPPVAERQMMSELVGPTEWARLEHWLRENAFYCDWGENGELRFNPVVRQFLRDRYRDQRPDEFESTVALIVEHYKDSIEDALELSASAGTHSLTCDLVVSFAHHLLSRGSYTVLRRAIESVPLVIRNRSAALVAIYARVLSHIGTPDEALTVADSIATRDDVTIETRHHARLARTRALRLLGRTSEIADVINVPLDDVPSDPLLVAEHAWHRAHTALAIDSDFDRALFLLNEALEAATRADAPHLTLLCQSTVGQVLVMKGDAPAAVDSLSIAARGWRELRGGPHLAWVLNNLGMAHIMAGDSQSAVSCLREAREESRVALNTRAMAFAVASLGDAHLASGDFAEARAHYEETIKICAEEPLDESLVALTTAGLAGAILGLGDVTRADFIVRCAVEAAERLGSPYELATCLMQQAAVASAAETHSEAVALAERAATIFEQIGADASYRQALYRLALVHYRDGNREAAEEAILRLNNNLGAPWTARALAPFVREHPLFAKWIDRLNGISMSLRTVLRETPIFPTEETIATEAPGSLFPRVVARSLGALRVMVDGRELADEEWESIRAKELFYLFLAHPEGIRKEQAFTELYPDLPASRCNSQFHSNLYRVRKALYRESVVKRDGAYLLNPEGEFSWDVREFEHALDQAAALPSGSSERAAAYEKALQVYRGPFAEAFYSEWAASLRDDLARRNVEALAVMGGYYAGRSDFEAAAQCMEQVLKVSRHNDEAAHLLATYRSRAGQPAAALAFIDDYRNELRRDIGADLSPRLQRLRHSIASGVAV